MDNDRYVLQGKGGDVEILDAQWTSPVLKRKRLTHPLREGWRLGENGQGLDRHV